MEIHQAESVYVYKPDLFRGRRPELYAVDQLIQAFKQGDNDTRAILFSGVRGSGKSWLSFYLARDYFKNRKDVIPFLVRLWPQKEDEEPREDEWWLSDFTSTQTDPELVAREAVDSIVKRLAMKLGLPKLNQSTLEERSFNLSRFVSDKEQDEVLLFILDSAFEGPQDKYALILKQLQSFLLTSLLQGKRTIVIATGRGPQPSWYSSYLRDAQVISLTGFIDAETKEVDKEIVRQILEEFNSKFLSELDAVCELSQGYPLVIRLIAQSQAETLEGALDETINRMLEIITDQGIRRDLREVLHRLAAIEKPFREDEVVKLLAPGENFDVGFQQVIAKRDKLMDFFILEWTADTPNESGYVTNQSIIAPIRYFLKRFRKDEYRKYLELVIECYRSLIEQYKVQAIQDYYQALIATYEEKIQVLA